MSQTDVEREVIRLLNEGKDKKEIYRTLERRGEADEAAYFLRQIPYPEDQERYKLLNATLLITLGYITLKKFYFALSFGSFSLFTLIALVVPTINIYLFNEIRRYRRMGYELLTILSLLSLLNAENRAFPEVMLIPVMAAISGLLLLKMFLEPDRRRPWRDHS